MQTASTANKGFTLIELMITIAVMSILLSLAIPSMRDFVTQNRLSGNVNEFLAATMLARSEAMKRGMPVKICRSTNASATDASCSAASNDWSAGWLVLVPASTVEILSRQDALPSTTSILGKDSAATPAALTAITFNGTGAPTIAGATFAITDDSKFPRMVCFDPSGRTRVVPDATSC